MIKWACLFMLVIDILLFGAAGYRYLTIPPEKAPSARAVEPAARRSPPAAQAASEADTAPVQTEIEGDQVKFTIPVEGGEDIEIKSPPIEEPAEASDPGEALDQQQQNLDDAKAKMRERFGGGE